MSTTKRQSIFSRLSSSASSIRSRSSSTSSAVPKNSGDYNRYAKDGKGYDFNASYPYGTSTPNSSASSTSEESMPVTVRDFALRYARDGKGHDFTDSYGFAPTNYAMDLGSRGGMYIVSDTPRSARRNIRYAWHQGRQAS